MHKCSHISYGIEPTTIFSSLKLSGADLEGARGVSFEPPFSTYNIILTVFPLPKLLPPINQAKLERTKDWTRTQHLAVLFLINAHIHYSMCMSKHFYFC